MLKECDPEEVDEDGEALSKKMMMIKSILVSFPENNNKRKELRRITTSNSRSNSDKNNNQQTNKQTNRNVSVEKNNNK